MNIIITDADNKLWLEIERVVDEAQRNGAVARSIPGAYLRVLRVNESDETAVITSQDRGKLSTGCIHDKWQDFCGEDRDMVSDEPLADFVAWGEWVDIDLIDWEILELG